jgi:hypothetical protein
MFCYLGIRYCLSFGTCPVRAVNVQPDFHTVLPHSFSAMRYLNLRFSNGACDLRFVCEEESA